MYRTISVVRYIAKFETVRQVMDWIMSIRQRYMKYLFPLERLRERRRMSPVSNTQISELVSGLMCGF